MKSLRMSVFAFTCLLGAVPPIHAEDKRLMSEAEYKKFLDKIEVGLPAWEVALKKIDPANSSVAYAVGKQIVENRDLGLMQVGYVRQWVAKERTKHTVSGELGLDGFLRGVFDAMDSVVVTEIAAGVTVSNLEKYAPELSPLMIQIANDVTARVELLEKGTCP
jgi:hypothetical protein